MKPFLSKIKKNFGIIIYRFVINSFIIFNWNFCRDKQSPRVFYGGSLKGNIGGPLVKIKKLSKYYPEHKINFNIIYLSSNNSFVKKASLDFLKNKKIPIILNQNGVFYPAWFKGNYIEKNLEMSKAYKEADYVFWQSKFCKKASEKFLGKRKAKGEILYNAVDTKLFLPGKNYRKNFTFLITGNISRQSNYRIISIFLPLKQTLKLNKSINILIAGNIEDEKYLSKKLVELGIADKVIFLGKYTQKEAPEIYRLADAYITFSYQDNCPTAVLEAMASGLPVLYSDSGGIPELVDKNSGIGLKVKKSWNSIYLPDAEQIAEGMIRIIDNKISMSESARIRALEKFDISYWISRHHEIFNYFLDKNIYK